MTTCPYVHLLSLLLSQSWSLALRTRMKLLQSIVLHYFCRHDFCSNYYDIFGAIMLYKVKPYTYIYTYMCFIMAHIDTHIYIYMIIYVFMFFDFRFSPFQNLDQFFFFVLCQKNINKQNLFPLKSWGVLRKAGTAGPFCHGHMEAVGNLLAATVGLMTATLEDVKVAPLKSSNLKIRGCPGLDLRFQGRTATLSVGKHAVPCSHLSHEPGGIWLGEQNYCDSTRRY